MDKNTVTRTFSIGAICSGTKASDDFSTARRHSSAGIRALLWATSSARSLGCSLGSDFQTSRENIFPNILTPGSIPQFTIPSLSVQNSSRSLDKDTEEDDAESEEGSGSSGTDSSSSASPAASILSSATPSPGYSLVLSDRRAGRSVSAPLTQREMSYPCSYSCNEAQHCLDPASRAALSLPHLTKVTTPYGFITLSQSPQMASEEALLCQAGQRRLNKDEETACCLSRAPGTRAADKKGNSSHLSGDRTTPPKGSADSQKNGRPVKAEVKAPPASSINAAVSSSAAPSHADIKRKRRFYEVIRKHFTS